MRINEIFSSIQGEGVWTGTPMIFVRLQGCNLSCPWCDTKQAQDPEGGQLMSPEEVAEAINSRPPERVCFTGGEPLMQVHALYDVFRLIPNKKIHLETNGSYGLDWFPAALRYMWLTISPKPPSYWIYPTLPGPDEYKIIVTEAGTRGCLEAARWLHLESPSAVMNLQPVDNSIGLAKQCTQFLLQKEQAEVGKWRLSLQVHKFLGLR